MSHMVTFFFEFETEEDKKKFVAQCRKQIGWAWDIVGNELLDAGRFLSWYRDEIEWNSNRWHKEHWGIEFLKQPQPSFSASRVDALDAIIAMAQVLTASGVAPCSFGFIKMRRDKDQGNQIERLYWLGGWKGAVDPQSRLDITQQYVLTFDKDITATADDLEMGA